MVETRTAYDTIPYDSHAFPQSHPERLAAVAKLFGLDAPPVENCRVLELGCSMGGNLIAMAQKHPGSQFIGIDSSSRQVADGWKAVNLLGLKNIRLQHLDILDIGPDFGQFDYIISHGVFSWVPANVQNMMLEISRRHLASNGVAYFSYNTFPGWHIRGIVRDMMLYRGQQFTDPATRLAQAKSLVQFVAQAAGSEGDPYRRLLQNEIATLGQSDDYYLHHEHLEENNHPIYFHDFARKLGVHGLQYLGEAEVATMVATNFARDVAKTLSELGAHDIVQMEQYMDFVRCRYFRETLVCHSAVRLSRQLHPSMVKSFWLASQAVSDSPGSSPSTAGSETFRTPDGRGISCRSPIIRTALRALLRQWPMPVTFAALFAECRAQLAHDPDAAVGGSDEDFLAAEILACLAAGVVEWHLAPASYTTTIAERPLTSPSARMQAGRGDRVLNLRCEAVLLDALHRRVLQLLDGQLDVAQLVDALCDYVIKGGHELRREHDNTPLTDPAEIRQLLGPAIQKVLHNLARNALLVRQPTAGTSTSR